MPKRSPLTGLSPGLRVVPTGETTSAQPAPIATPNREPSSEIPDDPEVTFSHYAAAIQNLQDIRTGSGSHAKHKQRQIGRCVYCSCGARVQGRLVRPDATS